MLFTATLRQMSAVSGHGWRLTFAAGYCPASLVALAILETVAQLPDRGSLVR